MAFISMFIVAFYIVAAILAVIFFVGLITFILSFRKRKRYIREGKKPHKFGMVVGIVLMSIPASIVLFIEGATFVGGMKHRFYGITSANFKEKWEKESFMGEAEAEQDVMKGFLKVADTGEVDKIKALFTDYAQESGSLDYQIQIFLKTYPGELHRSRYYYVTGEDHESSGRTISESTYYVQKGKEKYYLTWEACTNDPGDPKSVGLERLIFAGEEEHQVPEEQYELEEEVGISSNPYKNKYILSLVGTGKRIIDGEYMLFTDTGRIYSKEEFGNAFYQCNAVNKLEKLLGQPNVDTKGSFEPRVVYQLESDTEEPLYAVVEYDPDTEDRDIVRWRYSGRERTTSKWDN